jgi:hypothetical protein
MDQSTIHTLNTVSTIICAMGGFGILCVLAAKAWSLFLDGD